MSDEAHEATPDHELERQIMSYNEAKNEREWWAMHEIERLREALQRLAKLEEFVGGEPSCIEEVMNYTQYIARAALAGG